MLCEIIADFIEKKLVDVFGGQPTDLPNGAVHENKGSGLCDIKDPS